MSRSEIAAILERRDSIESRQQEIGGDPLDELSADLDPEQIPESHYLRCSGLRSGVYSGDAPLGHILMTEWDDVEDPMIPLSILSNKPGISVLLRSSPMSYHLYNLSVRPFDAQIRDAAAGTGDLGHVRWAARRGYFVLRVTGKIYEESGETYKDPPELVRVVSSESEYPQSREHLETLSTLPVMESIDSSPREQLEETAADHRLVGDRLRVDQYQTVSDTAKDSRRDS